ncbi:MAG TPA: metallophosphoesterase [Candidatus Tectomicrobia bacterium]|jgi:predicted MPP superfamily phosphohydrolase
MPKGNPGDADTAPEDYGAMRLDVLTSSAAGDARYRIQTEVQRTMRDLRLKRNAIELGQLKTWSRRARSSRPEHIRLIKVLVRTGIRWLGLRSRGERNALSPVLKHYRFEFDALPEAFHGFRILHLSDLHVDGLPGLAECVATRLSDLVVDLCVLTGDYRFAVTGPCHNVYPNMQRLLAGVNARQGIVGILGNHDMAEMVPAFERLGVRMLMNESLELRRGLDSVWLVGVDDPHHYGCDDLPGALLDVPKQAFKILLVHTPELIPEADQHGVRLYLCGHTHGGQICLPFFGPLLTHANCPRRYVRGAWQYNNVIGYTSSGVGCSGVTARFLCPPEIVLIELCRTRRWESQQNSMSSSATRAVPATIPTRMR